MGEEEQKQPSMFQLFRYADRIDRLLLLLGVLGSIGDGMMQPLNFYVLGSTIDEFGSSTSSFTTAQARKYALELVYVATGVAIAAFFVGKIPVGAAPVLATDAASLPREGWCWTRTAERQTSLMRRRYLEAVLRQEVSYFDNNSGTTATFKVVTTISSDADTIQDCLSDKIPNILANITSFIFSIVVAFILSWRMTLAALPFSLLYIVPGVVYGKLMMDTNAEMRAAYEVAGGIAEQAISSIRTVVSYVGERQTLERFKKALERTMELGIKEGLMKGLVIGSFGMIFAVWGFQAWVGSVLVTELGAPGGSVFMAGICTIFGGLSLMSALPDVKYVSEALAASSRVYEMIDRQPPLESVDGRGDTIRNINGEIRFKNIEFTYPSRPNSPVLHGLSLRILAGQTIGLVGGSGSGKSTIISLLQRFYKPDKGKILLDSRDIQTLNIKWFRAQIGLVGQEPVLFATTIKENMLFGNEKANMDQVVSVAKAANAHDFITKLPDGYDTHVGHFGHQMSGGQKQRIAIARALIRDPKILLLDEATSALDAQSERLVQEALDQASLGRTTIIVAHRLSTLRNADIITVLQQGEIAESGTHEQLMRTNGGSGLYARMVQLQQSALEEATAKQNYKSRRPSPTVPSYQNSPASPLVSNIYSSCPSPLISGIPSSRLAPTMNSVHATPTQSFMEDIYSSGTEEQKLKPSKPSQWLLVKMNKPEWKRGLLGCSGGMAFGLAQAVHCYCLGSVVSIYFLKDNDLIRSKTKVYCFVFVTIGIISVIANIIQHYNFAIIGERLTKRVRENMLEKVLSFEIGWFDEDNNSSAAICSTLATEASSVRSLVGDRLSLVIQASTSAVAAFTLGLIVTWRLSIVMIAVQPLVISCFYFRKVLMTSLSKKAKKAQIQGSQLASEAVVNHRTITAFSSQKRILDIFEGSQHEPKKENIVQSWLSGIGLLICQFVVTSSIALTFWYGGKLMVEDLITPKHVFQAFFLLLSTGKLIADACTMTSDLAKGGDAIRSVLDILNRKTKIELDDPQPTRKKTIKGHIELKNVTFHYPSRPQQLIFNSLNLKVSAGTTMALVGQSGSGKSTVIGLIERFYDPLKGSVEIDGQNIKNYNLRNLRKHIALVSQEPTLFAGSIRENIAYGKENATENEIVKAAVLANAHEFISCMENGYDTYCGERGVQLSGGQKQRIALARAILKNPAILLLDEATSALDSVSEKLVQEAVDKMMERRTCVVVAHRLSTIQKSDCIALIKNGRVVEQGTHSELLSIGRGGAYCKLIKLQQVHSP